MKQQTVLEGINPGLRSFFRGKTATVESGIDAIISLVTSNKSANSCSQADLFQHICDREGVSKRIFLYQQRRFAKIGKAAACILQASDVLTMLLDEVQVTNQLVESCKVYMASELFITELECLAYFNHNVTFPFLNCVEQASQDDLLVVLPRLYNDLLQCKTSTLEKYRVSIHGFTNPTLSTDTAKEIVKKMCVPAAASIKLQCGREYGFSDEAKRASDISKLTEDQRSGLPTNNCISERDLSQFDRLSVVSRCRNRKFTAKNIRNNMMLYKCKEDIIKIDKVSKMINLALMSREVSWNDIQKSKMKTRIEEKLKKAHKAKDYTRRLLQDCKSWGGPATTPEELEVILKGKDNQQKVLRTELLYFVNTHKADKIANKELFRVNNLAFEEMLENMMVILGGDTVKECTATTANLPTNKDVLEKIMKDSESKEPNKNDDVEMNKMSVVVWVDDCKYSWYLGYVKDCVEGMYKVDHLQRKLQKSDSNWKYPSREDVQMVYRDQIISIEVEGEWDMVADSRKRHFHLTNSLAITCAFNEHIENLID